MTEETKEIIKAKKASKFEKALVALELIFAAMLLYRNYHPSFFAGQLLPCLVIGLFPGTFLCLFGKPSFTGHRIGVAVGLITFMFFNGSIKYDDLKSTFARLDLLIPGIALILANAFVGTARWRILLRGQEIALSYFQCLRLTFLGFFFSTFVPGQSGGDLLRAYYAAKGKGKTTEAITSVVLDRFMGLPPLILILLVTGWLNIDLVETNPAFAKFGLIVGIATGACVFVFGFIFLGASRLSGVIEKIEDRIPGGRTLKRLSHALMAYRNHPGALLSAIVISFSSHIITIMACYLFGQAAGIEGVPFSQYCILVPVGLLFNFLPISPGGLGVAENAFSFLFAAISTDLGPKGAVIMVCVRVGMLLCGLIGGILYAMGKHEIDEAIGQASHAEGEQ